RGPDELLSSSVGSKSFTMNNFTLPAENENDRKKFKGDTCFPSRVLHLREIPNDVTEEEIIALGLPFGKVTNILILKGKSQAFLEMASEEAAAAVVNYYNPARPHLRNQPIYVQFSHYRELKTDNLPNQDRARAALEAANSTPLGNLATTSTFAAEGGLLPGQGSVLRIIVENLFYPVTLEMLHQIFSKFGSVLKIITFTRNNQFQALLQYADPMNAYYAKMGLDGQSIYTACCTLRIEFSRLTHLKVKYNNEKSRDFTRIDLSSGDGQQILEPSVAAGFGTQNVVFLSHEGASGFMPPMGFAQDAGVSVPGIPGASGSLTVTTPVVSGQMTFPDPAGIPGNPILLVSNLN
ncbi:PTBP3 protein, partial [Sagittarius serpentarius]|nr:PTBP3 protein [Sagittarius serpentarius]